MKFRFIPSGLFTTWKLHGWRPEKIPTNEFRYGDENTIHHSGSVDVEIGADGRVCAVWFRCRLLPFTVRERNYPHFVSKEMNTPGIAHSIKAIVFDTQEVE